MISLTNRVESHRFKPYPAYKDSGAEWLGQIPADWTILPVKRHIDFTTGWTPPTGDNRLYDGENLWANIGDLGPRVLRETQTTISDLAVQLSGMKASPPGALLFAFKLSVGAVSITGKQMYTNEAIATFLPGSTVDVSYLYWSAPVYIPKNAVENIYGAALLNRERIGNALICMPPSCNEQRAIAAFLDRETSRIDALVARKERLIELLQEKRAALISRAVTKGLDSNVRMKDSGVDALGRIPVHWKAKRLKFVVPGLTVGIVVTPAKYYEESGVPCLRSLNVSSGRIVADDLVFISPSSNELHAKSKLLAGDLVIVRTGLTGTSAVVPDEFAGANCIDLLIVRRSRLVSSNFLWYFINSRAAATQIAEYSEGAIQAHYNTATLANLWIAVPPATEQADIEARLQRETGRLSLLAAKVRDAINRLKELRSALVYAAVTGKIDVREKVA